MEASVVGGGEQGFASRPSGAVGWAAATAFVWAVQSLKICPWQSSWLLRLGSTRT